VVVDGPARDVVDQMPQLPPVAALGRKLGWQPLPLTVKEARRFSSQYPVNSSQYAVGSVGDKSPSSYVSHPSSLLLEAKGVSFAYNGCPTLIDVDLQVGAGEAVAVMGRNGAGKSTLLKCVVGLLSPASGEVMVNGRSTQTREVADICREVGYLPQNPDDLLFADTVADELQFTLNNHGLSHNGVHHLLGELGLGQVAQAYPRDLSVEQRQRVALGAVTITRPKLLLLDEPTRGLDYAAKQRMVAIWRRWLAAGMGLLLVTHDVELTAMIADRVAIMSQGEIIAAGQTADILSATPLFAPQIARLFPNRGWLTVQDALREMLADTFVTH
jgi:energy-coupling factor transport system ATP-binding protein